MRIRLIVSARAAATILLTGLPILPCMAAPRFGPAALGPEVSLAQPEHGYLGELKMTPDHGPAGTPVKVSGAGLPPEQTFDLVWRTVRGRWKVADAVYEGRTFAPIAYRIAQVRTDSIGQFQVQFITPQDFGGSHDVVLQQAKRLFTQAGFSTEMTVKLSPIKGQVGTPLTVDVDGIGWRNLSNSWMLLYDNKFTGWISSVTTGGSARFTIPATGSPGKHVLEIVHGEFTFPYRNMQQSPEPDRPQFARQFSITEGPAVLPPPGPAQTQSSVTGLPHAGSLSVSPAFGTINTPIGVRGTSFTPGKRLQLEWSTVTGNRVGGHGWQEKARVLAVATTDAKGAVAFRFEAPDDLGGTHRLMVRDGTKIDEGTFWIAPSAAALNVDHGPAGTPFQIHLKGVGWTETSNIYAIVYDNSYIGYACGFNSQGGVIIPLYATGTPGWHFIDLYPAIYKGKEARPRNFRLPQLTYAKDHPGEDLPHFRFAFRID